MKCLNDPTRKYTGKEPSPKGLGYCAHSEKVGKIMQGLGGKVWVVKKYGNTKRWVLSQFYKDYRIAENKLRKLLSNSIIKFKFMSIEDKLKEDKLWFNRHKSNNSNNSNIYFPEISIEYKMDKLGDLLGNIEFKRCACESEFYKYIIQSGSDIGPIQNRKRTNRIIPTRTFYYEFDPEFTIWKDFEKECKKYHAENINFLKSNFNIIEKLSQKNRNYIKKHYNINI